MKNKSISLKDRITKYVYNHDGWVHKGKLGRMAVVEWGYENENMGRRCRELVNEGIFERRIEKGCVEYKCEILPFHLKELTSEEILRYSVG